MACEKKNEKYFSWMKNFMKTNWKSYAGKLKINCSMWGYLLRTMPYKNNQKLKPLHIYLLQSWNLCFHPIWPPLYVEEQKLALGEMMSCVPEESQEEMKMLQRHLKPEQVLPFNKNHKYQVTKYRIRSRLSSIENMITRS